MLETPIVLVKNPKAPVKPRGYFNGVLIMHRNHLELELPRSLRPKIGFFKRSFDRIPELAPFRERAAKIVSELNRLKTIRHDAVHGVALE